MEDAFHGLNSDYSRQVCAIEFAIHLIPDLHDDPLMLVDYFREIDQACVQVPFSRSIRAALMARVKGDIMKECFWYSDGDVDKFKQAVKDRLLWEGAQIEKVMHSIQHGMRYYGMSPDRFVATVRKDIELMPSKARDIITAVEQGPCPLELPVYLPRDPATFLLKLDEALQKLPRE